MVKSILTYLEHLRRYCTIFLGGKICGVDVLLNAANCGKCVT